MALKQRENIVNAFTKPVGSADIAANSVCKLSSSVLVVATASTEASAVFIITEFGFANKTVRCAGLGSIVLINAHDGDLAEGEWWVPAALGRVDSIATLTVASAYYIGQGLQASSAAAQKVALLFAPGIAPKSAS
ncbi:hypothetical protein LCGC14_2617550 [marine sediment metagenome]|uniref:Uncharacterized protein n=1 Tax=marine sediment metagenome TaxID=412755 RepID=A0A0F9A401_9ZZZZ